MENLRLIEYKPSYAKAVAEMWRRSSEGWNGNWDNTTEEMILKELDGSTSINIYLAEHNGEILGYCDFSEYLEDEAALYIKLLNVRYDCHGKSIGRTLVCKTVERTMELGWPRLDLYTWTGNTKSIPLYKRCGFFFENRDDTTHLMNFIPYAINTEATKDFFEKAHWYKDLKREINMKPDGRKENGFDFYEYVWQKDDKTLRMEFERRGRGLRLIETDDYIIKASIANQELIFGQKYKVLYEVINKSGKPLNVEIKGVNNKNIKFNFNTSKEVNEEKCIEGEFFVEEFKEELNPFKTYPVVVSNIFINGKKAEFKLGITPKAPAVIKLTGNDSENWNANRECFKDVEAKIYLDIENSFDEEAIFSFKLIDNEDIKFLNKDFEIKLKAKEKNSFEVPYILKNFNFYSQSIVVTALLKDGRKIDFKKRLTSVFRGREGVFGGEGADCFIIVNGPNSVKVSKVNNKIYPRSFECEDEKTFFNIPKLGKPYTAEFSNIKAKKAVWYKDGDSMVLKVTCASSQFKNIEVTSVIKLSANGTIEHYHEVYNNSEQETQGEICLLQGTFHNLCSAVIPVDNKFIKNSNVEFEETESLNLDNLSENWVFARTNKATRGLCWNKNLKPKMSDWLMSFEHSLGKLKPQETKATEPIKLALNTFKDWKEFRDFVLDEKCSDNINTVDDLEISINNANPFVKENFDVKIIEHKPNSLNAIFTISSDKGSVDIVKKEVDIEEGLSNIEFNVNMKDNSSIDILKVETDLDYVCRERKSAVFKIGDNSFEKCILEEQGHRVYSISNGVMNIKASPTFAPALYSMVYKKHDWLESSFPTPRSKSWFNPWIGGIMSVPENLSLRNISEEKVEAEFINMKDYKGNTWRGIKTRLLVENNDEFKGLEINQYFLMLPGVPVLCYTKEFVQNTGNFMNEATFVDFSFFNIDKDIKNNYLLCKNRRGETVKYRSGRTAQDIILQSSILYGSEGMKEKLQIVTDFESSKNLGFINANDTAHLVEQAISAANKESVFTRPVYYIFTEEMIDDDLLKDLI